MVRVIMYFNLRSGVSEKDFVGPAKEFLVYLEGKLRGLGSGKLFLQYGHRWEYLPMSR